MKYGLLGWIAALSLFFSACDPPANADQKHILPPGMAPFLYEFYQMNVNSVNQSYLLSALFYSLFLFCYAPPMAVAQSKSPTKVTGTYYIMAPSGLNLRESVEASSEKVARLAYGEKVELLRPASQSDMFVDGIPGGMAQIQTGDHSGYAFDGYLSRFPAPLENQTTEAYVESIRNAYLEVFYESNLRDWGGYIQQEEAITLFGTEWAEAFLIAKQLYRLPAGFAFPSASTDTASIIPNPKGYEHAWTDELAVKRSVSGDFISISYSYRAEGGGKHIIIEYIEAERGLRISETQIAD